MKSAAVVALALLESAQAFQAAASPMRTVSRAAAPAMFAEGDIGEPLPWHTALRPTAIGSCYATQPASCARASCAPAPDARRPRPTCGAAWKNFGVRALAPAPDTGVTPPLGVFDPLGLISTKDMRRFEIMEIKHGRAAMFGFLHVILIHAGVRFPGYLSIKQDLKFADMPAGCFASLEATPTLGWLQIMAVTCAAETGFAGTPAGVMKQLDDAAPGDIGGSGWKRYDDPAEKAFKLNAERNNGRAAMLGITGCLIHELLGVDALYPTGGMGGAAPPTIW
jgi:light-harvesting complex I chlorophyll a/b binding protein 1